MTGEPDATWRPTAPLDNLRRRAEVVAQVRAFFSERDVLEVETPCLSRATVTDVHLASLCLDEHVGTVDLRGAFLQTSPEFHMKRLLAAGTGPIFQLARAFRDGESGRLHNPEFTMLEWYRPGWDHHRLMDEVGDLLTAVLGSGAAERVSYRDAFRRHTGLDPFTAADGDLERCAADHGLPPPRGELSRDDRLHLVMSAAVEPQLGRGGPTLVYDYPASQAALARIRPGDPSVAERFEAYVDGLELANGYHELVDADEQRRRFDADLRARERAGLPPVRRDDRLLAALAHGLPPCAGVALGLDRLVMLACGAESIDQVIAFPVGRA
jgi:lysyl-tRNA synthetase class 2